MKMYKFKNKEKYIINTNNTYKNKLKIKNNLFLSNLQKLKK